MGHEFQAKLSALIESTDDMIWSVDLDDRLTIFNQAFARYIQDKYGNTAALGMLPEELGSGNRAKLWIPLYERAKEEGAFRIEIPGGGGGTLELSFNRVIDEGTMTGVSVYAKDITQFRLAEKRVRESEERFRATFEQAGVGIVHTTFDGKILRCNRHFAEMIGYTLEEAANLTLPQITASEDLGPTLAALDRLSHGDISNPSWEKRFIRKDGSRTWVRLTVSIQRDSQGNGLHFIKVVEDINARKDAEVRLAETAEALRISEDLYRTAFQTSFDAISISSLVDERFVDVNQGFLDLYGFDKQEILGRTSLELGIWDDLSERKRMVDLLRKSQGCKEFESRFVKKNGEKFWARISTSTLMVNGIPCVMSIGRDITAARAMEEEIRKMAFYDPLTQLPNRRLFLDRLHHCQDLSNRNGQNRALLFIDLDRFKPINDSFGHKIGDLLLQEVARRLGHCVRESDTLARLAGDEFVVLLESLSRVPETAVREAGLVGEKILKTLGKIYDLEGQMCRTTASVGIAMLGHEHETGDAILQRADSAMYRAKAEGGNTLRFFETG